MNAYFITAIGTDVGKTFVTAALLHAAKQNGIAAQAIKPVSCGATRVGEGDMAEFMSAGNAGAMTASPFWYKEALSPNMAAAAEGKILALDALCHWTHNELRADALTLVEGVGGAMVPLNEKETVLDFISKLALPVILVASNYLGALNHTLLTLEALRAHAIPIKALIVTEAECGVSLASTYDTLCAFTPDIAHRIMQPRVASWREATAIHTLLKELV